AAGLGGREGGGDEGRAGEDPGLRAGETDAGGGGGGSGGPVADDDASDGARDDPGDGRVHVAGAGERRTSRLSVGPVFVRIDSVRDGDGQESVRACDGGPGALGDHQRGAGGNRRVERPDSRATTLDR